MKLEIFLILSLVATLSLSAQVKRQDRKSLLDADPDVVYLEQTLKKPIELTVTKEAPVFSDKSGKIRLGSLKADQIVRLEAITDKIYRIRGQGTRDGIAGWVAPWAFSSSDPGFIEHLKQLYTRQIQVQALIKAKEVATGMTLDEVKRSLGEPTKTTSRKTDKGQSGRWEFIDYEEIKHFITRIDPATGKSFRQLSHITQEEKRRVSVEFADDLVTAIETSEDLSGGNVRIIVPPIIFGQ